MKHNVGHIGKKGRGPGWVAALGTVVVVMVDGGKVKGTPSQPFTACFGAQDQREYL